MNLDGDYVLLPLYGQIYPALMGFLDGDINICDLAQGSLNSRTCTFNDGDTSHAAALLAAFPRAAEIAQAALHSQGFGRFRSCPFAH